MAPRTRMSAPRRAARIELPTGSDINSPTPSPYGRGIGYASTDKRQKVADFIRLSRKQWQTADAASRQLRQKMRRDQRFASGGGNQWDESDRNARADEGRPCIEINRIPQFIRQVSNQNRANRTQIQINPRGRGGTKELAAAIQGITRSIEIESDADVAYDTATDRQLTNGLGCVRLFAKWATDDSRHQVCRIGRVRNPLAWYWDPSTQEADFADMRYSHLIAVLGKDEYDARWGSWSNYASLSEFMAGERQLNDWVPEGKVVIAEYFYVTLEPRDLLFMASGADIWRDELDKYREMYALVNPDGPEDIVQRHRSVEKRVVRWALHNGIEILEGNDDLTAGRELPGTRIPLYPLLGEELDLDGEVDYKGMVRDAIDPQKMYNFWSTQIAEAVALTPKAPWVAAKGQIEQYMDDWATANRIPHSVLVYDPKAVGDHLVPAPQRNVVGADIGAMVQGLTEADRDLMSVMGLYEPSLGERGGHSESGKAREALQRQGDIANSNFLDNLQRMKRAIGRSILEWIPIVYDTPRIMHLIQPDGKKLEAVVHAGKENAPRDGEFPPEITKIFDISVGHYDVTVSTGPPAQSEQQATEAWLLDLFKVLPGLAAIGADIVLENSDNPVATQLAARAKKAIDPKFLDETDPDVQIPKMQAENAQLKELLDKAHTAITAMADTIKTKELDNATKKQVAMIQADAAMAIAQSKIGSERDIVAFQADAERFHKIVDQIHEMTLQEAASAQAIEQQTASAQLDAAQQTQQTQDTSAQSAQDHAQSLQQQQQAGEQASQQADQGHQQTLEQQAQAAKLAPKPSAKK